MIIPLLRTLYHPEDPAHDLIFDARELHTEIREHSIGAQVYHLLKTAGIEINVSSSIHELLYRSYETGFLQSLLIKRETEKLLKEFENQGVPVIPLKGTILAERYYGHYAARGTSDIDLLIHPEHLEAAVKCVRKCGFNTTSQENPVHYHHEWFKQASGLPEPLAVELHWSLVQSDTSQMNMGAAWTTSEPLTDYKNVRVLSPSYTFYTLCLHGASHQMDSLKYVVDLLHMLERHHEQIDFTWVLKQADLDHTRRRIGAALSVVSQFLPDLASLQGIAYEHIHIYNQKSRLYRLLFTLSMLDSWRYRWIFIARLIIPSQRLALYSLGTDGRRKSWVSIYYNLYKQRFRKLWGGQ